MKGVFAGSDSRKLRPDLERMERPSAWLHTFPNQAITGKPSTLRGLLVTVRTFGSLRVTRYLHSATLSQVLQPRTKEATFFGQNRRDGENAGSGLSRDLAIFSAMLRQKYYPCRREHPRKGDAPMSGLTIRAMVNGQVPKLLLATKLNPPCCLGSPARGGRLQ